MWIFTCYGFYSIACADKSVGGKSVIDSDTMMIRARVKKHLENLQHRFPVLKDAKILTLPGRDYGFRIIVSKAIWVEVLKEMAEEQTWSNFKNEAAARKAEVGADYIRALHDVWWEMNQLQESAKFS